MKRLGPDTPSTTPVVDTVLEHSRFGIVVRQYVRENEIHEGSLVHTHRLNMRAPTYAQEAELDLVDHATGSMLQRLVGGGQQPLQIRGDLDEIHRQLSRHLGFPDPC